MEVKFIIKKLDAWDKRTILEYNGFKFEAIKKIPKTTKVSSKYYSVDLVYPDATIKTVLLDILIW